jgi:hypothetical protein
MGTEKDTAIAAALADFYDHPEIHGRNKFAADVISKFKRYGTLTDAQVTALVGSLERDRDYAKRDKEKPRGAGPEGRQTVSGVILSVKEKLTGYGPKLKMLVELPTGAKVYVSVPRGYSAVKGASVCFTATFTQSSADPTFSFGNRPEITTGLPPTAGTPRPEATELEDILDEIRTATALRAEPKALDLVEVSKGAPMGGKEHTMPVTLTEHGERWLNDRREQNRKAIASKDEPSALAKLLAEMNL